MVEDHSEIEEARHRDGGLALRAALAARLRARAAVAVALRAREVAEVVRDVLVVAVGVERRVERAAADVARRRRPVLAALRGAALDAARRAPRVVAGVVAPNEPGRELE